MSDPRATILVPTHNKPTTLPLTVATALAQSVTDLEVILIGDGVTDEVRAVCERLVADDARVRFLDLPKSPHHGERYRHDAVVAARSEAIFYLCDDDLLLPDHVADLLALLTDHQLVQCFNAFVRPDGSLGFFGGDLAGAATRTMLLREDVDYNSVSITGTAHRRDAYLALADPWDTTPAGAWPDLHQWRKFLRQPDFTGATSHRVTALQFPTSAGGRHRWTDQQRQDELARWYDVVTAPDAQEHLDALVLDALRAQVVRSRERRARLQARLTRAEARWATRRARRLARRRDRRQTGSGIP